MKQHAKKIILIVVALCLVIVGVCLGLKGCGAAPAGPSSSGGPGSSGSDVNVSSDGKATYTVELDSAGGMALADVGVYVYTDSSLSELVWFDQTDEYGMMSFTDVPSDSYVAVLQDLPVGYAVEEYYPIAGEVTKITLYGSLLPYEEMGEFTYEPGAMVYDFTVTTADGACYTLSELLQEKKAIVLNFWYLECAPCKSEFPAIQQVYEKYGDDVIVLAMNPVNTDAEAIAALQKELGLTFPMTLCDPAWQDMMAITGYPTTVVIDRYGMISLIHSGAVTNPEVWDVIFAHYTSDEYEQAIYEDITVLAEGLELEGEMEEGSEENPIELGGELSFEVTVPAGGVVYYDLYKVFDMILQIKDPNAYVIYNNKTYEPNSSGVISLTVNCADPFSPATVAIGNKGEKEATFTLYLSNKAGSINRPYALSLGEFTTNVAAGNDQGVYYTWTAPEAGTFTLQNISCTSGVEYGYTLYNLNSYAQRTLEADGVLDENGVKTVSVKVNAGDTVQVIVGTLPDSSYNYPAATIKTLASFTAGEGDVKEEDPNLTYTVTVTDADGKAMPGVTFNYQAEVAVEGEEGKTEIQQLSVVTDLNGVANLSLPAGTYTLTLIVPTGYTADAQEYVVSEEKPDITVQLKPVVSAYYFLTVVDDYGAPVQGARVIIGKDFTTTDPAGKANFYLPEGGCSGIISLPSGYISADTAFSFENGNTALTITVQKLRNYTVTVVDETGVAVPDVAVSVGDKSDVTDKDGAVIFQLVKGSYTAKLTVPEGYVASDVEYAFASGSYELKIQLQKLYDYTVTVVDEQETPLAGLELTIDGQACTTDQDGKAAVLLVAGEYTVQLGQLPDGYEADAAEYVFGEGKMELTITLRRVPMLYTIQAVYKDGVTPIEGMTVSIVDATGDVVIDAEGAEATAVTDIDGVVTFSLLVGDYTAQITAPDGYYVDVDRYAIEKGNFALSVSLQKLVAYTVTVEGENESGVTAVPGVTVAVVETSGLNINAETVGVTDANGKKIFQLPEEGTYVARLTQLPEDCPFSFTSKECVFDANYAATFLLGNLENYYVNVVDETGAPIGGVSVTFNGTAPDEVTKEDKPYTETYNTYQDNGQAVFSASTGENAAIVVPDGYRLANGETDSKNFGSTNELTFKLQCVRDYVVSVVDGTSPVTGVTVTIGGKDYITDRNGKVSLIMDKADYGVTITVPDGYRLADGESVSKSFGSADDLTFQIKAVRTYTVNVLDENSKGIANVTVTIGGTAYKTDASGKVSVTLDQGSYTAAITLPSGYQLANGENASKSFGSGTALTFRLGVPSILRTYTVNLVDYTGKPVTDVDAVVSIGGKVVDVKNGVATVELDAGSYPVDLILDANSGYKYAGSYTLTADKPSVDIVVAKAYIGTPDDNQRYPITEGAFYVNVTAGGTTIFQFDVETAGIYKFQAIGSGVTIDAYGSSFYQYKTNTETVDNSYTKELSGGDTLIGIEADSKTSSCILVVSYVGEIKTLESISYQHKDASLKPVKYTLASGKTLRTFNLANASGYTLTKGDDGFYYYNGNLVMVDFAASKLDIAGLVYLTGLNCYFDASGNVTSYANAAYKEEYNTAMREYVDFVQGGGDNAVVVKHFYQDVTGSSRCVYPLNDELMYMLQMGGGNAGWWNPSNPNYLFTGENINNAIGWMYFLVYAQ